MTILGLSLHAQAEEFEWSAHSVQAEGGFKLLANLYKNGEGDMNIGIYFKSENCPRYSDSVNRADPININGVVVKTYMQCIQPGVGMNFPSTDAGRIHMVNQFKISKSVDISGVVFSAKGFTKEFNRIKNMDEGI